MLSYTAREAVRCDNVTVSIYERMNTMKKLYKEFEQEIKEAKMYSKKNWTMFTLHIVALLVYNMGYQKLVWPVKRTFLKLMDVMTLHHFHNAIFDKQLNIMPSQHMKTPACLEGLNSSNM